MKSSATEPIVFQRAFDLTQWYAQRTPGFPKTHRFTLGDRLEHPLFDLLASLQDAAYGKNRATALSRAQVQVDRLRLGRTVTSLKIGSNVRRGRRILRMSVWLSSDFGLRAPYGRRP